jgi:hypothetical protein
MRSSPLPRISFDAAAAALRTVDAADVLERAKASPEVYLVLSMLRPRNWWGSGVSPAALQAVASGSGIPVAWVPRAATLVALAEAAPHSRSEVLLAREPDVVDDCEQALEVCRHPSLADEATLARRAVAAFRAGHHEAAMALAVSLGEPLAKWWSVRDLPDTFDDDRQQALDTMVAAGRARWSQLTKAQRVAAPDDQRLTSTYQAARYQLAQPGTDPYRVEFRWEIVAAPIPKFFHPWQAGKEAPPTDLSRHVIAHQPTVAHLSRRNALVAQMFVVSLLRERQHWADQIQSEYDIAEQL